MNSGDAMTIAFFGCQTNQRFLERNSHLFYNRCFIASRKQFDISFSLVFDIPFSLAFRTISMYNKPDEKTMQRRSKQP